MPRPPLWCPLLTRHTAGGGIDADAMRRHAATLRPHVDGLLMPGSTGDGWQLDDAQTIAVARLGAELAREHGFELLAGAFAPTLDGILARAEIVLGAGAPGIAVCAPHGDLAPGRIEEALENVLALGQPTALYQLPQITGNRIAPETAAALAARHPNFRWFKDSSGEDTVAHSGLLPSHVLLVRGAEGDYARWLAPIGPYHGFLLSTANCFPAELRAVVDDPSGQASLSRALSAAVAEAFAAVNKALDHALRARATGSVPPPLVVHGGATLPDTILRRAAAALEHLPADATPDPIPN